MSVDDLVLAVESHRQHIAPLIAELSDTSYPCFQSIARRLDDNGRRLESLCAGLSEGCLRGDETAG